MGVRWFADAFSALRDSHYWPREFYLTAEARQGASLTLRVDAFNVLNRVNYVSYVGNLSSPFFGLPVAAWPAWRMQFNLRFKF